MILNNAYRAAVLLKEAATETSYFAILGKQTAGTALLGLSFFSKLLDNGGAVVFALVKVQKYNIISTSFVFLDHVYKHGIYLLAHLATCVTALFWQAHRMHNYLGIKKIDPNNAITTKYLQFKICENSLRTVVKENVLLNKMLDNPDLRLLLSLKEYFSKNLQGQNQKLVSGTEVLMDIIFKAVDENQPISPFTRNAEIVLENVFERIPKSEEKDKYSVFLDTVREKWS